MTDRQSYKYVHIFLHSSTGFNLKLLELICDPGNGFNVDEQLFVTSFKPLYNVAWGGYKCHIEYCEHPGHNGADMVNMYGNRGDWLIVHSFPRRLHRFIFDVDKRYLGKMLWRTWGHDVDSYVRIHSENPVKDFILKIYSAVYYCVSKMLHPIRKKRIQNLYAVGIGNVIDAINVKECYGLSKTYLMPYPGKNEYEILRGLPNEECDDGYYHVMVGHSGSVTDRHCEVIDVLKPYENEKIMLHVALSYGPEGYIQKVKKYVEKCWHGKIEIFENTVKYEDYAKYMNKMDAVILDAMSSCALGNLSMILLLKKKLFLNRNGVLKEGLIAEKLHFHYTDEIPNMSFEEFRAREEYTVPEESTLMIQPYEKYIEDWKKLFKELNSVHEEDS